MNLKALIATAAVGATVFGGIATAEAKPQDKTLKHCKKNANGNSKRMVCQTSDDKTVNGVCTGSYEPVQVVELGADYLATDLNSNGIVCYEATLGVTDDKGNGS
jgi:hypothetical protein